MTDPSFYPRTALITGASSGFGRAIARRLHREGCQVVLTGRRVERLVALQQELGQGAHAVPLDVTNAADIALLPTCLPAKFADIDILVNNAGLALGLSQAADADLDDWDRMIATNISGLVHITHAFLPGMLERNRGHIINIGSTAASYPYPGGHVYGATKAFVAQFTLNLKADLVGTGVKVSVIEPGLCGGTEFSAVRFHGDQAKADAVYQGTTPLNADDIAASVAWLVSLPAHVNINRLEMMPVCQGPGPLRIERQKPG